MCVFLAGVGMVGLLVGFFLCVCLSFLPGLFQFSG